MKARAAIACALAGIAVVSLCLRGRAQAPTVAGVETFDAAWRLVRDTHFDAKMNGVDWEAVATELRPQAAAAGSAGELRAVLRDMLGRLGQSHFVVIPATADSDAEEVRDLGGTPGFDVRLIANDLVVAEVDAEGGAARAGVRTGWALKSVDARPATPPPATRPESLERRDSEVEAWRLAQGRLRGPAGSSARMVFEDGTGAAVTRVVERRREPGQPVTVGNLPTMFVRVGHRRVNTPARRTAGLIHFNVWMAAVDPLFHQAVDELRDASGIIVDLRGNPGGLAAMLMGISGHFIDERTALGVMKTRGNELRFNVNPRRLSRAGERVQPFAGPVALLVDGLSGSASECFSGGMQSLGRARVFGQTTMGRALPALFARLPNQDVLLYAFGDFITADGTRLEGRGVIPDEVVPLDRQDLLAGRDRPLEAALAWVDKVSGEGSR